MERARSHLLVFGLGYSGSAIAAAAARSGFAVTGTSRDPSRVRVPAGVDAIAFSAAEHSIAPATHIIGTVPPDESGDPVLERYGEAIANAAHVRWAGYLSTTGVYGDRRGAWVDEDSEPSPGSPRTQRRLAAERAWSRLGQSVAVDLFRLAGIYGPGRSVFGSLRAGTARRIVKPGHRFGRIHRDDIAQAALAAMQQERGAGVRVLNLVDDEPAESALVIEEAARLLGMDPPPEIPFKEAASEMSPMARGFWAESRQVASRKTRGVLGIRWRYPSYREGLRATLAEERGEGPA
jgi:nucleoside-diphosphate-sugar epimerase